MNASGSTSQAANISEALEIGAELLLVDEDTSATNFMIRDERMQALVAKEKEPITPFIDQIIPLKKTGVSSILALGGSGDYLDLADTVIMMDAYRCRMVTGEAQRICGEHPTRRQSEGICKELEIKSRIPLPEGLNPSISGRTQAFKCDLPARERIKIKTRGTQEIGFGPDKIDLSALEQLVHDSQTRFIGELFYFLSEKVIDGERNLRQVLDICEEILDRDGLDKVTRTLRGDLARPRRFEVAAALNRLRSLRIKVV